MNETIKAKTSQRLSSSRKLSCCPLRVSLSSLRGTIVPLLLVLLAVLANASYPLVLPPNPLCAPLVKNKKRHPMELRPFFLLLTQPSKGSWHPKRTPSRPGRALVASQGAPLMRRLQTASSLMPTAPYAEFSCVSTTRSIRDRTYP